MLRNGRSIWDDGSEAPTVAASGGADVAKNSRGRAQCYGDCFRNELPASDFLIVGDAADAHGRIVGGGALNRSSSRAQARDLTQTHLITQNYSSDRSVVVTSLAAFVARDDGGVSTMPDLEFRGTRRQWERGQKGAISGPAIV